MKINEIATRMSITENAVRFYEEKGLIHPHRLSNGYRDYREDDEQQLQLIILYRRLGFSICHIKELLGEKNGKTKAAMFFRQQAALNHQIKEMEIMRDGIQACLNEALMMEASMQEQSILKQTVERMNLLGSWQDRWNFDGWAEQYDQVVQSKSTTGLPFYIHYDDVLDRCAALVNEVFGDVLEIGVGTGNLAGRILCKQDVVGIDQSIQMLLQAKHKFPKLSLCSGTFLDIPFPNSSFMTVVSSYAFHHNEPIEQQAALQEMDRVLKKGGRMIICDLMFQNQSRMEEFASSCSPTQLEELRDEYFAKVDELMKALHELGYKASYEQLDEWMWIVMGIKANS